MHTRINLYYLSASVFASVIMTVDHLNDYMSFDYGSGHRSSVVCVRWCAEAVSVFAEGSLVEDINVCGLGAVIFQVLNYFEAVSPA